MKKKRIKLVPTKAKLPKNQHIIGECESSVRVPKFKK